VDDFGRIFGYVLNTFLGVIIFLSVSLAALIALVIAGVL
jgi:hypothetical protein